MFLRSSTAVPGCVGECWLQATHRYSKQPEVEIRHDSGLMWRIGAAELRRFVGCRGYCGVTRLESSVESHNRVGAWSSSAVRPLLRKPPTRFPSWPDGESDSGRHCRQPELGSTHSLVKSVTVARRTQSTRD